MRPRALRGTIVTPSDRAGEDSMSATKDVYDFTVVANSGTQLPLSEYRGRVLLIVNTASKCGFTPQFAGLEQLWQKYGEEGLTVVGFPCNQFANQDPGSDAEVLEFCQVNYGVTFPMMAKIDVNGSDAEPLFGWLTAQAPGFLGSKRIKWNFTKFLIGRDGRVIARYSPNDDPAKIAPDIEKALAQPA
jgi:glutathione peroxidase